MKTKISSLLIILTLVSCLSNAQDTKQKEVKSALEAYINAGDINNVEKLKPHLHSNFRVALYDAKKRGISILDKSTYLSFIGSKKFGGYKRKTTYENIEFIGKNMASIKATLTSPGKPTLKNFYSLVKTNNAWVVIQDYVTLVQ
ncbi:nuclear transport factor 2 family protein [uncultured Tenacibaculum sp.]|uniref:nuclear transport factor 2 family protein n=1 Tax=uncultured Tenacibaculum sp. TaxID=174713 RepID=UPI002639ABE3|nr:nuclear transport factor 2 family protein [uncultured Tenacibaculum sp.]